MSSSIAEGLCTRQSSFTSRRAATSRLSTSPSSSASTARTTPSSSPLSNSIRSPPSRPSTPFSQHASSIEAVSPPNLGHASMVTPAPSTTTITTQRYSRVRFRLEITDSFENADAAVIFPPPSAPHIPHVSTISNATSSTALPSPHTISSPSVGPRTSPTSNSLRPKTADPLLLFGRNGLKYLRSPECKLAAGTRVHPYRVVIASVGGRARTHVGRPLRKVGMSGAAA